MEVSGSGLSLGQAKSVVQFDLSSVKTTFDGAYGAGSWGVESVTLELTAAVPAHPMFNKPPAAGAIQVQWIPSDNWIEGSGTPNSPAAAGLSWQDMATLTTGAENEGTLSFDGNQSTVDYALTPSSGFLSDIAAGNLTTFVLSAADTTVNALFNTRSNGVTSSRPHLIISIAVKTPQFDIQGPAGSGSFGEKVVVLPNGNIVVVDSSYSIPSGAANVGAVYLYNHSGKLLSTLTGSTADDAVGSGGITVLSNGNYVVSSPHWANGSSAQAGAVTWCSSSTGLTDTVSASNSLVGSSANDQVGNDQVTNTMVSAGLGIKVVTVVPLTNGHYVVVSPGWSHGAATATGAVTWCDGTKTTSGPVSAANSLTGTVANDAVGNGGVVALSNGHYVVGSYTWNDGSTAQVGAVTWANGNGGTVGAVSAANSLVGSSAGDQVGSGVLTNALKNGVYKTSDRIVALTNGNYVVNSPNWQNNGLAKAGAVTLANGNGGTIGAVTASNSLVGSASNDSLGSGSIVPLPNGNYVIASPHWHNAGATDAGAATWGSGTAGVTGTVTAANSLVGASSYTHVSEGGITALTNGHYVVSSPTWSEGTKLSYGAATWGNGGTGTAGIVSSTNSLIGASNGDQVGVHGVTALTNGNYVVCSPYWDNGSTKDAGAATWCDGSKATVDVVSTSNSLVGTQAQYFVGNAATALTNGNYVVSSSNWYDANNYGAFTWQNGSQGSSSVVSASNSLLSGFSNSATNFPSVFSDVVPLTNGHYVVNRSQWSNSRNIDVGAVIWCDGTQATSDVISANNSLTGSSDHDRLGGIFGNGEGGVFATNDGHYVVLNAYWNSSSHAGAVTLGFGGNGILGPVTPVNSVLGSAPSNSHTAAVPVHLSYDYDSGRGQLVAGRPQDNIVSLFNPSPGIQVSNNGTPLANGDSIFFDQSTTSQTLTLLNQGLGDLTGITATLSGDNSADFNITTAPVSIVTGPRGSTTVTVAFTSTSSTPKYATLSIASSDTHHNSPFVIQLAAMAPKIQVLTDPFSNGQTFLHANGETMDLGSTDIAAQLVLNYKIIVSNTGSGPLTISSLALTGSNPGEFILDTSGTLTTLPANAKTSFYVAFKPKHIGPLTATLQIVSNDHIDGTFNLNLKGTGTGTPVAGTVSLAETVYKVNQGATSVTLTLNRTGGTLPTSVKVNTLNGAASTVPPFSAATAGVDFSTPSSTAATVNFAADENSKTMVVALIPKIGTTIPNKRFTVTLSNPTAAATLGNATATVQILAQDSTGPTLTVSNPTTATTLSAAIPYLVTGTAGDAHGVDRVTLALNGASPVDATLAAATSPTSVPFSGSISPIPGANTLVVTAYDLRGNNTSVTRKFSFTRRYLLGLARSVPSAYAAVPDNAGTIALTASASQATSLTPTTANAEPHFSQCLPTTPVSLVATSKGNSVFSHWLGLPANSSHQGNVASLNMPAADTTVTAVFVDTPFNPPTGLGTSFQGLVHATGNTLPGNDTEGYITGTLASSGVFTGKIFIDGLVQPFVITFFGDGSGVFTDGKGGTASLTFSGHALSLSYNATGDHNLITASLTHGTATSGGAILRAAYSATHKLLASTNLLTTSTTGTYTVIFPAKAQNPVKPTSTYPQGHGFATMTLSNLGAVTFAGTLADGSAFTTSSTLVASDACPVFAQLLTPGSTTLKGGSFGGNLQFLSATDSDVTGTDFLWFRPTVVAVTKPAATAAATNLYTAGWPEGVRIDPLGTRFYPLSTVQSTLGLATVTAGTPNASLAFSGGKLAPNLTKTNLNITKNTVTKIPSTDASFTLVLPSLISTATGRFSGTFTPNWSAPSTTKPAFNGVVIQIGVQRGGWGFFISNAVGDLDPESGKVFLSVP